MYQPSPTSFSSAAGLEGQLSALRPRHRFAGGSREDWRRWRSELADDLRGVLGPLPNASCDLRATVVAGEKQDGFVQYRITYQTRPGVVVPAYLLIPDKLSSPCPAVVCAHGHVPGGKESVVKGGHEYGAAYGAELARMGLITLCPDNAGMGERARPGENCDLLWRRLNYLGQDLTGYRVYDLIRAVDYLQTRPEVNAGAIGIAGLSGGCWLGLVTAALDERICAAVLSGYFTTFAQTSWEGHCVCHHPKGMGLLCEMPDIAGLIAPRPVFVEWGNRDVIRPVHPAFEMTQAIYEAAGARENLLLHEFDGDHLFDGQQSLPWLCRVLRQTCGGCK